MKLSESDAELQLITEEAACEQEDGCFADRAEVQRSGRQGRQSRDSKLCNFGRGAERNGMMGSEWR